jgi:hypothetical protein
VRKIFVSILLILFTVQPLLAQGLEYRNSELNILMNTKTDAEKENKPVDLSMRSRVVTSIAVGGGLGLLIGLLLAKNNVNTDSFISGIDYLGYSAAGLLIGGIVGGIYGAVTHENPTPKKSK